MEKSEAAAAEKHEDQQLPVSESQINATEPPPPYRETTQQPRKGLSAAQPMDNANKRASQHEDDDVREMMSVLLDKGAKKSPGLDIPLAPVVGLGGLPLGGRLNDIRVKGSSTSGSGSGGIAPLAFKVGDRVSLVDK